MISWVQAQKRVTTDSVDGFFPICLIFDEGIN